MSPTVSEYYCIELRHNLTLSAHHAILSITCSVFSGIALQLEDHALLLVRLRGRTQDRRLASEPAATELLERRAIAACGVGSLRSLVTRLSDQRLEPGERWSGGAGKRGERRRGERAAPPLPGGPSRVAARRSEGGSVTHLAATGAIHPRAVPAFSATL